MATSANTAYLVRTVGAHSNLSSANFRYAYTVIRNVVYLLEKVAMKHIEIKERLSPLVVKG
jgi:hypothetical protein